MFAEDAFLDEQEDHFSDIWAGFEPPFGHHGAGHGAKFLQCQVSESDEEFAGGNVAVFAVIAFHDAFDGEVERFLQEVVGAHIVAWVTLYYGRDGVCKLSRLRWEKCSAEVALCQVSKESVARLRMSLQRSRWVRRVRVVP